MSISFYNLNTYLIFLAPMKKIQNNYSLNNSCDAGSGRLQEWAPATIPGGSTVDGDHCSRGSLWRTGLPFVVDVGRLTVEPVSTNVKSHEQVSMQQIYSN